MQSIVCVEGRYIVTRDQSGTTARWGTRRRGAMHLALALIFTGTLILTANAPVWAHPTTAGLPTVRLPADGPLDVVEGGFGGNLVTVNAGLVRLLPGGKVVPDLATWTISTNQLVYTFTIRKDARFSNGHPVTARDAEFTFLRDLAPTTPPGLLTYFGLIRGAAAFQAGKTATLSGVKVLNTRTLRISITKPAAYFLALLASFSIVFERSILAGKPIGSPDDGFNTNYLDHTCTGNQGAGPFRFACHDRSSTFHSFYSGHSPKYTLVPNHYYYGRKPHITLELYGNQLDPSFDTYKAYLADKIDATFIPQVFLNQWRGKSREYHEFPSLNVRYIVPNVHLAPFNNVHCRLAMAYAIDRETIANHILSGAVHAAYTVVPKGILGYYSGKDNPHYNPAMARAELARCPSRTIPFELKYRAAPINEKVYPAIASMVSAVGMNVKLKPLSGSEYGTAISHPLDQTNTQAINAVWGPDYPDPQNYCTLLLRSGQHYNFGSWHDAPFDRLVDRADVTLNRKERATLYIRAQHRALSQGAFVSLNYALYPVLTKPYVQGVIVSQQTTSLGPKGNDWANVSVSKH